MKTQNWTDCTGDVVVGDTITFTESVFGGSYRKPKFLGERTITATVERESYGGDRHQHTFSLRILSCDGGQPIEPGKLVRRKGRNIYRHGTLRQEWADESARNAVADEKHARGNYHREMRAIGV